MEKRKEYMSEILKPGQEYADWKAPETSNKGSESDAEQKRLREAGDSIDQRLSKTKSALDEFTNRTIIQTDKRRPLDVLSQDVLENIRFSIDSKSRRLMDQADLQSVQKAELFYQNCVSSLVSKGGTENKHNASGQERNSLTYFEVNKIQKRAKKSEDDLANYLVEIIAQDPTTDPKHLEDVRAMAVSNTDQKASKIVYLDAKTNRERKFGSRDSYLPR